MQARLQKLFGRNQFAFFRRKNFPFPRSQISQFKATNPHAQQTQRRMPDGRRHAPYLAVFALDQFQTDPAIRHAFAKTDRRHCVAESVAVAATPRRRRGPPSLRRVGKLATRASPPHYCDAASQLRVAAPTATRGRAASRDLESTSLVVTCRALHASESVPPAPNTRAHARGADAADVRSIPVRHSTAASLPNPRRAVRWDRHFSES